MGVTTEFVLPESIFLLGLQLSLLSEAELDKILDIIAATEDNSSKVVI